MVEVPLAPDARTRRDLEEAVPSVASSLDGRRFSFRTALPGLTLMPGDYLRIGADRLGHVHSIEVAAHGPVSLAQGHGVLLDGLDVPFHEEVFVAASADLVVDWVERTRPARATLDVGTLSRVPAVRFPLDAGGFDRHTFFCGQSGSGKTYALGTVLERLLTETSLRIVVLDPNSDFVRLGEVRDDVPPDVAQAYRAAAAEIAVRRAGDVGADPDADGSDGDRLHVNFRNCSADEQAAILKLDPIRDREEYGALADLVDSDTLEAAGGGVAELRGLLAAAARPETRSLGTRLRNLGIDRWQVWSQGEAGSVQELVAPGGPRCVVVDLGSLGTPGEQAVAAEAVLAALWRRRSEREPVLIVIDEAHNVCPRVPGDAVTAMASELTARIAAEGRKFGLYLLVSTQRPQRVNELVVSQCDNLVLMRMNAAADLAYLADTLSFAPEPLLSRATDFRQGEALVAGKIASHATFARFGPRIAQEGGSDVPTAWAGTGR
ncbi:ATP-binding protein [Nocardioides sp. URHA0020]|uniref:ATP-binding protein n=1 Tax=Nocardioides sp. URHA0020 TaxID=1380392 RepID=UPI000684FAD1|nr:ATP-binding protein [Nocardioides sp. URHA0020]